MAAKPIDSQKAATLSKKRHPTPSSGRTRRNGTAAKANARALIQTAKEPVRIQQRRRELVDAAITLFAEKGYHPTTTREIAHALGWSVGNLYNYVRTKEEILYLVCEAIHAEMERALQDALHGEGTAQQRFEQVLRAYFTVCDRMQDSILLVYQQTSSLSKKWRKRVLAHEKRITQLLHEAVEKCLSRSNGRRHAAPDSALLAETLTVLGHMWAFRRWSLASRYTLDEYIRLQSQVLWRSLSAEN
jgi:AcrR family transcriptional regulator